MEMSHLPPSAANWVLPLHFLSCRPALAQRSSTFGQACCFVRRLSRSCVIHLRYSRHLEHILGIPGRELCSCICYSKADSVVIGSYPPAMMENADIAPTIHHR